MAFFQHSPQRTKKLEMNLKQVQKEILKIFDRFLWICTIFCNLHTCEIEVDSHL
jgi:hypothetical protein